MQKSGMNFKTLLGILVALVFIFLGFASMMGSSFKRIPRMPTLSDSISRVEGARQQVVKTVLSHEDQEKIQSSQLKDKIYHHDNDAEAKDLAEKVRVLCWVMTSPQNLDKKAQHVKNTWGKRCNILLFMSSIKNDSFPTVGLNVPEGRGHLTAKSMLAFRHVYENYFDKADWFMKSDDDTYVIVENLRYFLSGEDPKKPVFFGHHFKPILKQGFFSGGAGYTLSKEALRRFGEKGKNASICQPDGGTEDVDVAKCMQNLGVKTGNSTDVLGRSRFHCFDPETHIHGGFPNWYYTYDAYGANKGQESISDYAISFHYVPPKKMYTLEFYIYHLRPYGIQPPRQDLNQKQKTYGLGKS